MKKKLGKDSCDYGEELLLVSCHAFWHNIVPSFYNLIIN
ncbi:MAG: hypothetical protein ACJAWQ_000820 [Paraglaciecola sp.]|jgi:hypothetical protein